MEKSKKKKRFKAETNKKETAADDFLQHAVSITGSAQIHQPELMLGMTMNLNQPLPPAPPSPPEPPLLNEGLHAAALAAHLLPPPPRASPQ